MVCDGGNGSENNLMTTEQSFEKCCKQGRNAVIVTNEMFGRLLQQTLKCVM
jgi:hypothetical protein